MPSYWTYPENVSNNRQNSNFTIITKKTEFMLISVLNAPTEPNLNALACKMATGMTKMQKSVIGSICAYLMSCNAGFRKRPRSCPNEYASRIWNQLKKYFIPVYNHLLTCRFERCLAEANANRNTHFMVRHFRGMMSSEDSRQLHRQMRMAVSAMITTQDEGPT